MHSDFSLNIGLFSGLWGQFSFAKDQITKAISYGAGNSKFLKTEIGWISEFGRTSASQQTIILWDSAYSIRNDWLKKKREDDTTSGNPLRGLR